VVRITSTHPSLTEVSDGSEREGVQERERECERERESGRKIERERRESDLVAGEGDGEGVPNVGTAAGETSVTAGNASPTAATGAVSGAAVAE
jgi:hypothetical protein